MHYLQKSILDKLRYEQPLTYTAMMPDGIESSHFRYHLKLLITDGLVLKQEYGTYMLTDKGEREVDYLSNNRTTITRTPKVITYTLLTYQDTLVLYKKPKEPYRNLVGLIGGKAHFGETMPAAAQREVLEKTGIEIPPPTLRGVADILITRGDEHISHVTAYIHSAELSNLPVALAQDLVCVAESELHAHELLPDLKPILSTLRESTKAFVIELRCKLK